MGKREDIAALGAEFMATIPQATAPVHEDDLAGWEPTPPPDMCAPDFDGPVAEGADTPAAEGPEPVVLYVLSDDWATEYIEPQRFALGPAFPLGCATMVSGAGGEGKSFFMLTALVSKAIGKELIPPLKPSAPGRVMLLSTEDRLDEIRRRLQRIAWAYRLTDAERAMVAMNLRILAVPSFAGVAVGPGNVLVSGEDLVRLQAALHDLDPEMVVMDTLSALLGGAADENDNSAAARVLGLLTGAMPKECALVIVTHTSKADRAAATTPRGAFAWVCNARQSWGIRPLNEKELTAAGLSAENTTIFCIEDNKANLGPKTRRFYLERCQDTRGGGVPMPYDLDGFRDAQAADFNLAIDRAIPMALLAMGDIGVTVKEAVGKADTSQGKNRGRDFRDLVAEHAGLETARTADVNDSIKRLLSSGELRQVEAEDRRKVLRPAKNSLTGNGGMTGNKKAIPGQIQTGNEGMTGNPLRGCSRTIPGHPTSGGSGSFPVTAVPEPYAGMENGFDNQAPPPMLDEVYSDGDEPERLF